MLPSHVPVGNFASEPIYAGKFVTFLGYEVHRVDSANLNFSRGLLFTNAILLTHTGVYADYKFNDIVEANFSAGADPQPVMGFLMPSTRPSRTRSPSKQFIPSNRI